MYRKKGLDRGREGERRKREKEERERGIVKPLGTS